MHIFLIIGIIAAIWLFLSSKKLGWSGKTRIYWSLAAFIMPYLTIPAYWVIKNFFRAFKFSMPGRQSDQSDPVKDVTGEMLIRCSHCGNFYPNQATNCPKCGQSHYQE